jgi:uncharacterized membrane protein (UPF0182 family)
MPKAARFAAVIVVVVGLLTFLFGRSLVVIGTDALWFDAVGYGSVFQTTLVAQIGIGVASALGAFALLQANAVVALSRSPGGPAMNPELVDNPIGQLLMRIPAATLTGVVSTVLALFIGLFMSTQWSLLLLFLNGGSFGWTEPVLGHDASFYVFTLPLLSWCSRPFQPPSCTACVVPFGSTLLSVVDKPRFVACRFRPSSSLT